MSYQEEGIVYELPWEYECSDDANSVLTKEQYQEIVSIAEWQPDEHVSSIVWQIDDNEIFGLSLCEGV